MTTLHARIRDLITRALEHAVATGELAEGSRPESIGLERPRAAEHGDLATNVAFGLARTARKAPRAVAEALQRALLTVDGGALLAGVEVAGPGFVNLRLCDDAWRAAIVDALRDGEGYGRSSAGGGERVLLEFVSANPTGPMHVGHGRGAVFGDALARVMRAAGFDVTTEYYVNDVGNQIAKLAESVFYWLRDDARRAAALAVWADDAPVAFPEGFPDGFPEDGYRGAYIAEIADALAGGEIAGRCARAPSWDDDAWWAEAEPSSRDGRADDRALAKAAVAQMRARIAADLELLDIHFDGWFSERVLHGLEPSPATGARGDAVADCVARLQARGWVYDGEGDFAGAKLFRGTHEDLPKAFRDGKDRVVLRSDGRPTYFAADIAYHDNKLARGYDHLINVLGADHHGYVPRLQGVIHALGDLRGSEGDTAAARWSGDRLEVLLMQMVSLLRDGNPVPMGKRSGEFVTLRDVIDEVATVGATSGRDAVRFLFLTRKGDAQLDFDLEVARRTSMDNPVYYVQYAHARLASIRARAVAEGVAYDPQASLAPLASDDERTLAMAIAGFPELVARAAIGREPHQLAFYAMDLAKALHGWYSRGKAPEARVISDDAATTAARLRLCAAAQQVLANALSLLGVSAPEQMDQLSTSDAEA